MNRLAACALVWLLAAGATRAASQTLAVLELPTRPAVTQRYLWLTPQQFDATVLLLVGGNGHLAMDPLGALGAGGKNFLARSRELFLQQGLAVALPDAPSDRQSPPYLSGFRHTPEHVADLRALIADIRQRTGKPVVLVGTSRGTQSAAFAAIALADGGGPDALVLTSSILSDPQSHALPSMELERLRLPVLLVHHQQDGCRLCLYADLPPLIARLQAPHQVLSYQGGSSSGDPCEALAFHGYNGLEPQVVGDIAAWIHTTLAR